MLIDESYAMADDLKRYGGLPIGRTEEESVCLRVRGGFGPKRQARPADRIHADTAIGLGTVDAGGHSWRPEEKPEPDPLVFDWDKWLRPCWWRPYNSNYKDRGECWDFHAGLHEWASHTFAMAEWAVAHVR